MRIIHVVTTATLVLAIAAGIAATWMVRHLYFRYKLALTEPVAIRLYAEENMAIQKIDAVRIRVKPRVVLIGDSRVRAMRLRELENEWEIVNRGVDGETSAQLFMRFDHDALALKPEVIVIQSGINDLVAGIGAKTMAPVLTNQTVENIKKMAVRSAAAGSKVVILTVIPPAKPGLVRRVVWSERVRNEVASVNASLLAWKPPDGVNVIDLSEVFGSRTVLPPEYALNTLHLNHAGYARLEKKIGSSIASLVHP